MKEKQGKARDEIHQAENRKSRQSVRDKFFLCFADELDGEHERLIQFLVRARSGVSATRRARMHLRREWCDYPDRSEKGYENVVASFFGGEIMIRKLRVRQVTPDEALQHFTRG